MLHHMYLSVKKGTKFVMLLETVHLLLGKEDLKFIWVSKIYHLIPRLCVSTRADQPTEHRSKNYPHRRPAFASLPDVWREPSSTFSDPLPTSVVPDKVDLIFWKQL
eukprot:10106.XXX_61348_61665_1 [CDS] Oithona nana genome sequencing.